MIEDLTKILDVIDENTKLLHEFTSVAKNIIAKNPDALTNNLAEHVIKTNFGDSIYDRIRKSYQEFIGT